MIGADSVLHESEDFYSLVEAHHGRQLKLYVYNLETDKCRDVIIIPDSSWGGEGSLGCGIGYGYLHRIPHTMAPQETAVGESGESQEQVDKRKKTFSSALGIATEEGQEALPQTPNLQPVTRPDLNGSNSSTTGGIGGFVQSPPTSTPAPQTPSETNVVSSPAAVEIPGMPPQITTPLSIPGMPPITVSAPVMMPPPPFSSAAPPTAAPPPTPNDPSWFANAAQNQAFPQTGYYQPQAPPQFTPQMYGQYNPQPSGSSYSPNATLPVQNVPLFNPVAPNINDNNAPTNSNFIRIFDPTAPPTTTTSTNP